MNRRLARLLVRLYPRSWRERYGAEFEALLEIARADVRTFANVVWSALHERAFPTQARKHDASSFSCIVKKPSALLPVAMSLMALALVLVHIAVFGIAREADEGATAHLWQLLMAGQVPVLAFFAIKWLPRTPAGALLVLALQAVAGLAAAAPVFLLRL